MPPQRNPERRIVLIEAQPDRLGGVGPQRRVRRREPDARRRERKNALAQRDRHARRDGDGEPRRHAGRDPAPRARRRVAAHRHAVGRHRTASGRLAARSRGRRERDGFSTEQASRGGRTRRPIWRLSSARTRAPIVHPAKLAFELARACQTRACTSTSTPTRPRLDSGGARASRRHRRGDRHRTPGRAGDERVPEPAAAQPAAHRAGLRLRAGHRTPHRSHSWTASAGATGRESATAPTSFTTTGSPWTTGSCGAATTRSITSARKVDAAYEDRPADVSPARRALLHHVPPTRRRSVQPPVGGRHRHQHAVLRALGAGPRRPGGLRQRVHRARAWALRGSPPTCASTCSRAARHHAPSCEMVRERPLPFPPEPLASVGIQATRWSLDRADHSAGRRNVFLRTLDALGLGFDS